MCYEVDEWFWSGIYERKRGDGCGGLIQLMTDNDDNVVAIAVVKEVCVCVCVYVFICLPLKLIPENN